MLPERKTWGRFLTLPLLTLLFATVAFAGTNEGFTASLSGPTSVKDAEIGQTISIAVEIQNATQAKGGLVTAKYDAAVVEFVSFAPGSLIAGMLSLPGTPTVEDDGLTSIQGGGTQLVGTPGSGDGLLGTMTFKLIGDVPAAGSHISIVDVQIQASSSDKDHLTYEPGEFGVALTKTVLYTMSGVVTESDMGEIVAGATVVATQGTVPNRQTFTADTDAEGQYSLEVPSGEVRLRLLPPEDNVDLKITRLPEPIALVSDTTINLVINALLPNIIFDLSVVRRHNAADLIWFTRLAGFNDLVQYRAKGTTAWLTATNPLQAEATDEVLADLKLLRNAGVDLRKATPAEIAAVLDREISAAVIVTLRQLDEALNTRRHLVPLTGLTAGTEYEFTIRATSLDGKLSPLFQGSFRTRLEPDVRPLVITNLNIQPTAESAIVTWKTNRPADTRIQIASVAEDGTLETVLADTSDEEGSLGHIILTDELSAGQNYRATVASEMVGVDALVSEGLMTEADILVEQTRAFRTRLSRPLRFLGPPKSVAGATQARILLKLNQPVWVVVDYGPIDDISGKVTQSTVVTSAQLYTDSITSSEVLDYHEITLADLDAATKYRYRITAYLPNAPEVTGDKPVNDPQRITTDPRGNRQWSRDFTFKTSLASDDKPPVFVQRPQVHKRARFAVVRWVTDVPTTGSVFLGTWTDELITLGTDDEFEIRDLLSNGKPRFARKHIVIISSLNRRTKYGYRIESTAANGKVVTFDPLGSEAAAGKRAKLLQPPGGAGQFTTDLNPDTQYPVILSGPSVVSKTHDTAVIEWTTDEPADSEVRFGVETLDEEFTSADDETRHKMVITNLTPGATYSYVVGSTDAAENGATESAQAIFTTNPEIDLTPPEITDGPEVIYKNDASATIRWTTDEDATTQIEYGPSEELGIVRSTLTTARVHEITLTNLEANTTYYYKVGSTDLSNNGPSESAVLSVTTDAEADLSAPVMTAVMATPADSTAIITWTSDELANSYVEFGTDSLSLEFNIGDTENVLSHEITLTNLEPGATYYYRVGSVDRANNANESGIAEFTTLTEADTTPPAVPFGLAGAASNKQVLLSWDAQLEFDLNGFNLYRKAAGDAEFTQLASGLQATSFADLNVVNETTYEYQVSAIDRQNPPNESAASSSIEATPTSAAAPSAPSNLTRGGDDVLQPILIFTNSSPFNDGATLTYTIQVSTEEDFSDVTTSTAGLAEGSGDADPGQTAWTIDRTLDEGGTYYWRVRAVEGSLIGPFSPTEQFVARQVVALPGDFNGDETVNFDDFFLFVDAFGQDATGDLAVYDLDAGGTVDFNDFFLFVDNFGKSATGKRWSLAQEVDSEAILSLEALGGTRAEEGKVTLRVWADQVERLKAYGLVLRYDAGAVEWEDAQPGPGHLLNSRGGQAPLFQVMAQTPGQLVIGNGLTQGEPVSGHGMLAELTFRLVGSANDARFDLAEALVARSGSDVRRVQQLRSAVLTPQVYHLGANYPNPFNPSTSIEYALPEAASVELIVYDVLGRRVKTLIREGQQAAGFYTASWDGRDAAGRSVGSGIYFYRLQTPNFTRTYKMTLLK